MSAILQRSKHERLPLPPAPIDEAAAAKHVGRHEEPQAMFDLAGDHLIGLPNVVEHDAGHPDDVDAGLTSISHARM
jgi:hypothetical protein